VSAGFDSAAGDEEGYLLTPNGYALLLTKLMGLAEGKIVVVLEGGYNIPAISHGLHACVVALQGRFDATAAAAAVTEPSAHALADIDRAVAAQTKHWACFQ
jgi:histone deacetylase 6